MTFSDTPIRSPEADRFNHDTLARRITQAVLDPRNAGANVIGVAGNWGSGKSGVLNLIELQIQNRSKPDADVKEYWLTPIRFEPWLVGTRSSLIGAFFAQLVQTLEGIRDANLATTEFDARKYKKAMRRLGKAVETFADLATVAGSGAMYLDPSGTLGATVAISGAGKQLLQKLLKAESSLEAARVDVIDALKSVVELRPNFRIIVFIDDLDRLEPSEALEVIRLVKAVAGFPYITYVLAYDEDVLARAIESGLGVDSGDTYLEKIVQFKLQVPLPRKGALTAWLEVLLRREFAKDLDFDGRRFSTVIGIWARRLLETPRDVIRLMASMRILWPAIQDEADFLDLLWLQLLKVKANSGDVDLYSWVYDYMLTSEDVANGATVVDKAATAKRLEQILEALRFNRKDMELDETLNLDPHYIDEFLPGIDEKWLSTSHPTSVFDFENGRDFVEFYEEKRLGSPRHWSIYFALDIPETALSDSILNKILQAAELGEAALVQELRNYFDNAISKQSNFTDQLLEERISPLAASFSPEVARAWVIAIFVLANPLDEHSQSSGWGDDSFFKARFRPTTARFLRRFEIEEYAEFFGTLSAMGVPIWALARFMRREIAYHQKLKDGEESAIREIVIPVEQTQRVYGTLAEVFAKMSWKAAAEREQIWDILFCWREIGRLDEASKWLTGKLRDDDLLLERLNDMVTYSYSNERISHLKGKYLAVFLDEEDLYSRIEKRARDDELARYLLSIWDSSERS